MFSGGEACRFSEIMTGYINLSVSEIWYEKAHCGPIPEPHSLILGLSVIIDVLISICYSFDYLSIVSELRQGKEVIILAKAQYK